MIMQQSAIQLQFSFAATIVHENPRKNPGTLLNKFMHDFTQP